MHLTINQETAVREERRNGDRYLVAESVPIVRPQRLSNGYVPEKAIRNSLDRENTHGGIGWDGVTVTLNHPRNSPEFSWFDPERQTGEPVLAANEVVQETLGLGELENAQWDGEAIRVDVAVNADRAAEMGGEAADVVDALEDNRPLDVSTQYIGAELPEGEYDGKHRDRAETIISPDSLALLPNREGQCSVEDGCGVHSELATANGVSLTLNAAPLPDDPDAGEVTGNVTGDPAWSSLGGELSRLREFVDQAIGSWRSLDEDQGGDGTLPRETTPNAEHMSKRAVMDRALTGNQFPDRFPFGGVSQCTSEMQGEVDDPGAFCAEWARTVKGEEPAANQETLDEIDTTPPQGVQETAQAALDAREETGNPNDCGTRVGWARANQLAKGESVSEETINRMVSFLSRHLAQAPNNLSTQPSEQCQRMMIQAWGGREGLRWAEARQAEFENVRTTENSTQTTGAESPVDDADADADTTDMIDRTTLIEEITANTAIERESLEGMGDQCLQTTHDEIVGNDADGDGSEDDDGEDEEHSADDSTESDTDTDDGENMVVMDRDELEAVIEDEVEQRVAAQSEQRQKRDRVESIVANSAEYGEDDVDELMETPAGVLDRIERGIDSGVELPASTGPDVSAHDGTDVDMDDVSPGVFE